MRGPAYVSKPVLEGGRPAELSLRPGDDVNVSQDAFSGVETIVLGVWRAVGNHILGDLQCLSPSNLHLSLPFENHEYLFVCSRAVLSDRE